MESNSRSGVNGSIRIGPQDRRNPFVGLPWVVWVPTVWILQVLIASGGPSGDLAERLDLRRNSARRSRSVSLIVGPYKPSNRVHLRRNSLS